MRRVLSIVAASGFVLCSGLAFAASPSVSVTPVAMQSEENRAAWSAWDTDRDGRIDYSEWSVATASDQRYSAMDSNSDGVVSRDEYYRGRWMDYDGDRNDAMDENEFNQYRTDQSFRMPGNNHSDK